MNYVFEITQLLVIKENFMPYSRENKGELIKKSLGFWTCLFKISINFETILYLSYILADFNVF